MDRIPTMIPHIWRVNLWKLPTKISKFTIQIHMAKITLLFNVFFSKLAQPLFGQLPKIPRVPHSLLNFAASHGHGRVSNFANWYNGDIMKYNLVGGLEHGFDDFPETVGNGISSSQLTNSIIFQRGRYTTNQSPIVHISWKKSLTQLKYC